MKKHICKKCKEEYGLEIQLSYTWNDTYKCHMCGYEIIDWEQRIYRRGFIEMFMDKFNIKG